VLKNIAKLLITIGLFWFLFSRVDFAVVSKYIQRADVPLLLMGLTLAVLSTVLASYRWGRITRILGLAAGWRFYLSSYFKGSFFNQALPGSIGGDAVRVIDLHESGKNWSESFYAVFIDRIAGLAGLLIINLLALAAMPNFLPRSFSAAIALICLSGLVFLVLIFVFKRIGFLRRIKVLSKLYELSSAFWSVYSTKREALIQIGVSILVHLFSVLCIFALARAVRLDYEPWIYCLLMPPVFLMMIIPVSLAGWGVRESIMVTLFSLIGADKAAILAVAMLYGVTVIVASLPGAFVWLSEKRRLL
jgi:hypothetical protein